MSSWIAATSGLAGVLIGVVGKYLADMRAGQRSRLFDEKIRAALRYLDAVEDYRESVAVDYSTRSKLKFAPENEYQEIRSQIEVKYRAMRDAFKVARQAESALVLLVPSVEGPVVAYLSAAVQHAWHSIEYAEVETAHESARNAIRRALGA